MSLLLVCILILLVCSSISGSDVSAPCSTTSLGSIFVSGIICENTRSIVRFFFPPPALRNFAPAVTVRKYKSRASSLPFVSNAAYLLAALSYSPLQCSQCVATRAVVGALTAVRSRAPPTAAASWAGIALAAASQPAALAAVPVVTLDVVTAHVAAAPRP